MSHLRVLNKSAFIKEVQETGWLDRASIEKCNEERAHWCEGPHEEKRGVQLRLKLICS